MAGSAKRPHLLPLAALLLALLPAGPALAYQLSVRADPDRVQAGERATSVITVEVRDDSGQPVPDRTEVRFLSTLGTITPSALTTHGMARVVLTCGSTGSAEVSVMVAGDRAVALVEFTADAGTGQGASRAIRVEGGWVAYSVDRELITASDGARFRYRRVAVTAQSLQYEVKTGTLRAQQQVAITSGSQTLEGERLCYWPNQSRGVMLSARDQVERLFFQGEALTVYAREGAVAADAFLPADSTGTRTWIVAKEVMIIPGERVQFTHASVYVNNQHLISLPYYIASFSSTGDLMNQVFHFSSDGGINLDLPVYYAASEKRVGSLHIRRSSADGFGYGTGRGFSLGLEEQYRIGDKTRGVLSLDNLTSNTRGFRWQHNQELPGRARADLFLNYYRYSPDYPGTLMGQVQYYLPLKAVDLNTAVRATRWGSRNDWTVDTTARYMGKPLGHTSVTYGLTGNLTYGSSLGYGYARSSTAEKSRNTVGGGLTGSLYFPSWNLGPRTTLSTSVGAETRVYTGRSPRSGADLRLGLNHSLGGLGTFNLGYSYSLQSGGDNFITYGGSGRQRLDANLYAGKMDRWLLSGYASYELDDGGLFSSLQASYDLPFDRGKDGSAKWRLDLRANSSKYAGWATNDLRLALGRDIGNYELLLCYSPTSSGYSTYGLTGSGSGKTIWLELGAGRF